MAPRRTLAADTPPHAFKPSSGPSVRCTTCCRGKASPVHHTESSPQSSSPSAQTQSSPTAPPSHTNTAPPGRMSTTMPRPTQSQCSKLGSVTGSGVRCPASPPCHVIVHLTSEQFTFYWRAAPDLYTHPLKWLGYYCTTCEYVHPLGSCCIPPDRNHRLFHVASDAVLWPPARTCPTMTWGVARRRRRRPRAGAFRARARSCGACPGG